MTNRLPRLPAAAMALLLMALLATLAAAAESDLPPFKKDARCQASGFLQPPPDAPQYNLYNMWDYVNPMNEPRSPTSWASYHKRKGEPDSAIVENPQYNNVNLNDFFFRQGLGGLCRWSVSNRPTGGTPDDEAYLVSPRLLTRGSVDVFVELVLSMQRDGPRSGADSFTVSVLESTSVASSVAQQDAERFRASAFREIHVEPYISPKDRTFRDTVSFVTSPSTKSVFVAIKGMVRPLRLAQARVYSKACQARHDNLMLLPFTVLEAEPATFTPLARMQCRDNAVLVPAQGSSAVVATCNDDGDFHFTGGCECDAGFYLDDSASTPACVACPAGTYKKATGNHGIGACVPCPDFSDSPMASASCGCEVPTIRTNPANIDSACQCAVQQATDCVGELSASGPCVRVDVGGIACAQQHTFVVTQEADGGQDCMAADGDVVMLQCSC